ncbi:MAG: hypothetical protein LBB88_04415, partial [Planctomycetaceae bacterium]|nr:hypothetical protein [Planctomycetaceae bacterium]
STLIYFASGAIKPEYESLPFDDVYLIDLWSFRNKSKKIDNDCGKINFEPFKVGKVTCIGMECLRAIDYLKSCGVKADCFAAINEGCYTHAHNKRCPLNSAFFFGYLMQILKDEYVHITNLKKYYGTTDKDAMELPYETIPITKDDKYYIEPKIFVGTKDKDIEIFRMKKINEVVELDVESDIKISVERDSIWNHYDELDLVVNSISDFERRQFFNRMPKVITWNHIIESKRVYCIYSLSENVWKSKFELGKDLDVIFSHCVKNKINKVGFTPWGKGNSNIIIEKIQNHKEKYPKEITLFHINKDNYKEIKTKYAKK